MIAYNLGNLWRRLVLPRKIDKWWLTSLQQRPVKMGGRLVKHARCYWLLLAESHLTRRLFAAMLWRMESLPSRRVRRAAGRETSETWEAVWEKVSHGSVEGGPVSRLGTLRAVEPEPPRGLLEPGESQTQLTSCIQ